MRRHPRGTVAVLLGLALLASASFCLGRAVFVAGPGTLLEQPLLTRWTHLPAIFSAGFTMFTEGQYRPLSYALLALVRPVIGGDQPLFWHLWLLAFHWLNALLVVAIVRRFARDPWSPLAAGLVFVLHPLATVVTNDLGSFHHLLGLSFFLGCLSLYLGHEGSGRPTRVYYVGAVGVFVLGLFVSKVVFSLPVVLAAYEFLYRRTPVRRALTRLAPFLGISLALAPLWWLLRPHPLHYEYIAFPPGATWSSLFSVISATTWYARGLLLGSGIPVVLHEVVEQIYAPTALRLLVLATLDLGLLAATALLLRRGWWGALGIVVPFAVLLPFASTTWNGVTDYVAWRYAYAGVAGLALVTGALVEAVQFRPGRLRRVAWPLAGIAVGLLGWQQIQVNRASCSALSYWTRVRALNPSSEIAGVALGKAFLEGGDAERAAPALFSGAVAQPAASSAALCRYFIARGELLPAAIHLRMATRRGSGMQFGQGEPLQAEWMQAAGAWDHAEEALGKVLTANPYDLTAMERLAAIWVDKGYLRAAEKLGARASDLASDAPQVRRMAAILAARRDRLEPVPVTPPAPSLLRYASAGLFDPLIEDQIVETARQHPGDPVLQAEAASCLARTRQYGPALERLQAATAILPRWAYAWAMQCWVSAEMGALDQAVQAGRRALDLDNRNATVHNTLGILHLRLAEQRPDGQALRTRAVEHFREALRINPQHASAMVNLAKELKHQGKNGEALALYRRVLMLQPGLAEAHFNMANLLADQGSLSEALESYRQAIRAQEEYPDAYHNMGTVLVQQRDLRQAEGCFRKALTLRPSLARSRDALAVLLAEERRFGEAVVLLQEGLRVSPEHLRGALMLASLLATCPDPRYRDGAAALSLAERASAALGNANPEALVVLAAAAAQAGDFNRATTAIHRALRLPAVAQDRQKTAQLQGMLASYQQRRPGR